MEKDEFTKFKESKEARSQCESFNSFLDTLREDMNIRSEDVQPSDGFWQHRPTIDFPPRAIRFPDDYNGEKNLNISCTQTDLTATQQKKLVTSWCEILPKLESVKFIWFSSRTTQEMFDTVTKMKNVEGVYIKWSGIKSIENIVNMPNLKYLHIGSTPSLSPLTPISKLNKLEWLELENIKACSDLTFLEGMHHLKGLSIEGDGNSSKYIKARSLEPLENLPNIYWLSLGAFMTEDGSLLPLSKMKSLKYLIISQKYKMEEVARLAGLRPDIECDAFDPISSIYDIGCNKCNERKMVLPTGKGKPFLCTFCETEKIEKHIKKFKSALSEHRFKVKK